MFAANVRAHAFGAMLASSGVLWATAAWPQQKPDATPANAKPAIANPGSATPAQSKGADAASEAERLLSQKAVMLDAYLGSERVAAAVRSGDPKNLEAVERARADFAEGAEALGKGDLQRAERSLNAGLRQVSTLVLQQGAQAEPAAVKKDDFKARRNQINSFMRALEVGSDVSSLSPWTGRLTIARNGLQQADALFDQEKYAEANTRLASIYEDVMVIVSEARRNQSIIYRLNFATPADEYSYELERNKSYEILVDIALAEKQNADKALRPYILKLIEQSRDLRRQAGVQAASGDHIKAIGTLETATRTLVQALRSAGVTVME